MIRVKVLGSEARGFLGVILYNTHSGRFSLANTPIIPITVLLPQNLGAQDNG